MSELPSPAANNRLLSTRRLAKPDARELAKLFDRSASRLSELDFTMTRPPAATEAAVYQFVVGGVFANWALMEHHLGVLGGVIVGAEGYGFTRGFAAIVGFNSKLEFVDCALVEHPDYERVKGSWNVLKGKLQNGARLRNEFAHHLHGHMVSADVGSRIRLVDPRRSDKDFILRQGRGVCHAMRTRHRFQMLIGAVLQFHALLKHGVEIPLSEEAPKCSFADALDELKAALSPDAAQESPNFPQFGFVENDPG